MNMIEKVARAIHAADQGGDDESWDELEDDCGYDPVLGKLACFRLARAAIEAMREPTAEMVQAWHAEKPKDEWPEWRRNWTATIDAALKEQ